MPMVTACRLHTRPLHRCLADATEGSENARVTQRAVPECFLPRCSTVEGGMTTFAFGRNWQRFLRVLDHERIATTERYLKRMLEVDRLDGMRFLDVGSGSGLSSLAAWRLGAI